MTPLTINVKTYQDACIAHENKFIMPLDEGRGLWGVWPSSKEYAEWRKSGGFFTIEHES